jgi:hypothetical protein
MVFTGTRSARTPGSLSPLAAEQRNPEVQRSAGETVGMRDELRLGPL